MLTIKKDDSNSRTVSASLIVFLIVIISSLLFVLAKVYEVSKELDSIVNEDITLIKSLTRMTEYQLEQAIRFERADRFGSPLEQTATLQTSFTVAVTSFAKFGDLLNREIEDSEQLLDRLYSHSDNQINKQKSSYLKQSLLRVKKEHNDYANHANVVFSLLLKNQATLSYIERVELEEDELDQAFVKLLEDIESFTFDATQRAAIHEQYIEYILLVLAICVFILGLFLIAKIKAIFVVIETAKKEIEGLHQQTKDSIEYASIIQRALLPNENILGKHFEDFFILWQPRDVIGGDIYLIKELNKDEVILMLIDCTGHGVPGAFVTMLVKAIEHQATSVIDHSSGINPASILSQFNQRFKQLLQQEKMDSESNVGFDGVILHVNQHQRTATFAGANSPLFILQNDKLRVIKGDKHSIGYKNSDVAFEFTNHHIDISQPSKIYISTDGYIDQTGGEKGFPYGTKKFTELLCNISKQSFSEQKQCLIEGLLQYENQRKDDISLIGFLV